MKQKTPPAPPEPQAPRCIRRASRPSFSTRGMVLRSSSGTSTRPFQLWVYYRFRGGSLLGGFGSLGFLLEFKCKIQIHLFGFGVRGGGLRVVVRRPNGLKSSWFLGSRFCIVSWPFHCTLQAFWHSSGADFPGLEPVWRILRVFKVTRRFARKESRNLKPLYSLSEELVDPLLPSGFSGSSSYRLSGLGVG